MHMFGVYSVINVAVLLNLLIAMMNHSYQQISVRRILKGIFSKVFNSLFPFFQKHADKEWKFARSKL